MNQAALELETSTEWVGLYRKGWAKGDIVAEAYSHPAKFSKSLIFKIIEYLLASGYVTKNDTILDPFGGVALGALPAMSHGLRYIGCELEPHFVALGHQNLELWRHRFGFSGGTLLQGDSRQLRNVLQAAGYGTVAVTVTSPPYADSCSNDNQRTIHTDGLLQGHNEGDGATYGSTPGNLGNMKPGALVTSPPFSPPGNQPTTQGQHISRDYVEGKAKASSPDSTYGTTFGQLAAMPMGDAVVSSPPFGSSLSGVGASPTLRPDGTPFGQGRSIDEARYGSSPGNLGHLDAETVTLEQGTFWAASLQILAEAFQILKPGAVAVFVLKDYVRSGKIVRFCDEWRRCCERVGFVFVEEIHALLSEQHGTQTNLFGADEAVETRRVSFFRRLAEKNFGSPKIDHEVVLIMRKPAAGTEYEASS